MNLMNLQTRLWLDTDALQDVLCMRSQRYETIMICGPSDHDYRLTTRYPRASYL
jgi:hypothetical protein